MTAPSSLEIPPPGSFHPETRYRVPVSWDPEAPCIQRVDRSAETVVSFGYQVHSESPNPNDPSDQPTEDEVEDGRTHQFFAFCNDPFYPVKPSWVYSADVDAAREHGLLPESHEVDVLELLSDEYPCWTPITTREARRPITFDADDEPVRWDVSALPVGSYTVWGYTWDPPFNLWSPRAPTVYKVHDGDPELAGPTVVVTTEELNLFEGDPGVIEGCIDTPEGSVLDAEIGVLQFGEFVDAWTPFAVDFPLRGNTFSLDVTDVAEPGQISLVRVTVTDPAGRSSTAYMQHLLIQLAGSDGECDEDDRSSFIASPCRDSDSDSDEDGDSGTGDDSETPTTETSDEASSGPVSDGSHNGSSRGCSMRTPSSGSSWWLLLSGGLSLVRRRRAPRDRRRDPPPIRTIA